MLKRYLTDLFLMQFIIISFIIMNSGRAGILKVGPGKSFTVPSLAFRVASDGDTIEIQAGEYCGDVATIRQNQLYIYSKNGMAHLKACGKNQSGKAIWVIKGDGIFIENVEFSGAKVRDRNGAGIRLEGKDLTLKSCYFHDNENGILTGSDPNRVVLIENCEFANNGYGDGQTHNIYVGRIKSFTLKFSYIHHAKIGHNVKSRAAENFILYNRIMDEKEGTSSYAIDLPNGGISYIIGNLIQQGPKTDNYNIISYGAEKFIYDINQIFIINNTIVNDRNSGVFLKIKEGATSIRILNNIFAGPGEVLKGPGNLISNLLFPNIHKNFSLFSKKPGFVDIENYDYRLSADSPAIDAGGNPGRVNDFDLTPQWEYVHPMKGKKRIINDKIDVGAYEFSPN